MSETPRSILEYSWPSPEADLRWNSVATLAISNWREAELPKPYLLEPTAIRFDHQCHASLQAIMD